MFLFCAVVSCFMFVDVSVLFSGRPWECIDVLFSVWPWECIDIAVLHRGWL